MTAPFDALMLVSFGGPEGPDDVWPFLENVTRGRGIPRERLTAVAEHYLHLGGRSPINDHNRALLAALGPALHAAGVDLPVYWGNRNWQPYLADELARVRDAGHRRVLALVTSAYPSESGCRQYRGDLSRALDALGPDAPRVDQVRPAVGWPDDPHGFTARFADVFARPLREALARLAASAEVRRTRVLFTTHSVPTGMAERSGLGGEYVANHLRVAEQVVRLLRDGDPARGVAPVAVPEWQLCYQSRSGPPQMPWLEPDVNDVLAAQAAQGVQAVAVVPIGFVSDHMEVVWDLDHEARDTAARLGLAYERVATPGVDPAWVDLLVDVVRTALDDPAWAVTVRTPCRPGCCAAAPARPVPARAAPAPTAPVAR